MVTKLIFTYFILLGVCGTVGVAAALTRDAPAPSSKHWEVVLLKATTVAFLVSLFAVILVTAINHVWANENLARLLKGLLP